MDIDLPLPLLGGMTPARFMQRHWQKKPLLVRQAISGFRPVLDRKALFDLAARDDVESRLVVHGAGKGHPGGGWKMRHGPIARRALPPVGRPGWTLLVQGVDLLDDRVHALLRQFRVVPDARLDDLMVSWASDGGGVGPHFDSYDVFLLQGYGRRRWRIGRQRDLSLRSDLPLKVLANFEPEQEFILEPGDIQEAINAANQIGDDTLERQATCYVVPQRFTHGSSEQRMRLLSEGLLPVAMRALYQLFTIEY